VGEELVICRSAPGRWAVVTERRLPSSSLEPNWSAPWDEGSPFDVLARTVAEVPAALPLVEGTVRADGSDVLVRFESPLFDEGLSQHAFAVTFSAVRKAARLFDAVVMRRADELAAWREFDATSDRRQEELDRLLDPMRTESAAPAVPPDTAAWNPTHETLQPARAWAQPDPGGAVVATIDPAVPVQVLERRGDWAEVLCSNGWSGWVDGRNLRVRTGAG
jgi:hypothetical protein